MSQARAQKRPQEPPEKPVAKRRQKRPREYRVYSLDTHPEPEAVRALLKWLTDRCREG